MNRSAYLTTGLAIKLLSRLSKADVVVHNKENLPRGPAIFVMNHFTRVETLLLPYYIYTFTEKPVWSLAAASLFKGGMEKFFGSVGVVSTNDPKRDELIVKSLLTGEANWIIFPEGSMVKNKKIVDGGKYMIAHPTGMHEPRTGAAALTLKAELFRRYIFQSMRNRPDRLPEILDSLGLESIEKIQPEPITIVPVNLTYYPIRALENIASTIASKLVKDIPERMIEEIMTEGTMLFSGVDLDIRFGKPIQVAEYHKESWLQQDMTRDSINSYFVSAELKSKMRVPAHDLMQRYMGDIYAMTTVNHEHLFASFLREYPFKRIEENDFKRRVFYATVLLASRERAGKTLFLHKSLKENQAHLLTDDRYKKYANFIALAVAKGVVRKNGNYLVRNRSTLSVPLSFHKGRIENPIEVAANEVEPLKNFQFVLKLLAWQPVMLLRFSLARYLLSRDKAIYATACTRLDPTSRPKKQCGGQPLLLPGIRRKLGVILVHSYLAVPEEVRALAAYLRRKGVWVYLPRLPGHGTSARELSKIKYREWINTVENSYVLMGAICDQVALGGVAVGGTLALDLAARVAGVKGVFAVCPPFSLGSYSTRFMPGQDIWNRLLHKVKMGDRDHDFLDFSHGNPHVNYLQNPVAGVKEVGEFLELMEKRYSTISQPALILQADNNPVVDPKGSKKVYDNLGSVEKEYCLLSYDRHVLVNGERAEKVFRKIGDFIGDL